MADAFTDGRTKVWWVPSIANISAPTAAELNAGTRLSDRITPDGLAGFEADTADVDTSSLNSTFNTVGAGRASFSGTMLRMKKQTGTDIVYNMLVRELAGYTVIRRGLTESTAWTVGDKVEVYPSICGEVRNLAPEANSVQRYEVPIKISSEPNLRATVA